MSTPELTDEERGRVLISLAAANARADAAERNQAFVVGESAALREALQAAVDRHTAVYRVEYADGSPPDCAECDLCWDGHEQGCPVGDLLTAAAALGAVPRSP